MKYKLQIEKLKQITMESVNKYCDKREELIVNQIINEAVWREYGQTLGTLLGEQELISNTFVRDLVKKICGSALRHSEEVLIEKLNQRQRTINDLSAELTDRDNLVETLNNSLKVRNDEAEQQDVLFTMLFEFAEWAALNYVRLNGVWCHRYAPQTNKDCWITTDKLFEVYKYKNDYSSQAGRV